MYFSKMIYYKFLQNAIKLVFKHKFQKVETIGNRISRNMVTIEDLFFSIDKFLKVRNDPLPKKWGRLLALIYRTSIFRSPPWLIEIGMACFLIHPSG